MDILIGREEHTHRLSVTIDNKEAKSFGDFGFVPQTVSRKHCKITIDPSFNMSIENIKADNVTYVDGSLVFHKGITITSKIELGPEKFSLPIDELLKKIGISAPRSLKHLENVWNEYQSKTDEITAEFAKQQNRQRLQGVCSMLGMFCALIPGLGVFRFIFMGLALLLALFFFWKGQNAGNSREAKIRELDNEYMGKYCCPSCGRPFMKQPYQVVKFQKGCPSCGCKYTV